MERIDDGSLTAERNRAEHGNVEGSSSEEYDADSIGGRPGSESEEDDVSSGLLGSNENLDTE